MNKSFSKVTQLNKNTHQEENFNFDEWASQVRPLLLAALQRRITQG